MSELTPNLKLFKYNTETDAKQPFSINDCMNANWDKLDASLGSLEIGDIGMSLYVDETKGKRRYLNGQIVDRNANTEAFFKRLQEITTLYPSLLCTEDEWQTAKTMSVFGQVGKFVFNYSGETVVSVRIPRVVNVQGIFDLQNLGLRVDESLPNITGTFSSFYRANQSGAFSITSTISSGFNSASGTNQVGTYWDFDASRSSSTYQDDAPVQQEAIQYPYFIQIATGAETENNIVNEIELNNPYSLFDSKYSPNELNNLSWLKSEGQWNAKAVYPDAYDKLLKVYNGTETVEGLSIKLNTEEYTDYDFVLNTADETFRLPLFDGSESLLGDKHETYAIPTSLDNSYTALHNGLVEIICTTTKTSQQNIHIKNMTTGESDADYVPASSVGYYANVNVKKGDTFKVLANDYSIIKSLTGIIAQGNGSLYYYVGETVQNANLIDAGRIGEQLANKQDKCIHIIDTYVNGTSGYRIWSDGYCEQWASYTYTKAQNLPGIVTLLKIYKDTNYALTYGVDFELSSGSGTGVTLEKVSTSQIKLQNKGATYLSSIIWKTSGYLAEGEY